MCCPVLSPIYFVVRFFHFPFARFFLLSPFFYIYIYIYLFFCAFEAGVSEFPFFWGGGEGERRVNDRGIGGIGKNVKKAES